MFIVGTSNAGNTNGDADPTGVANETDVRVLDGFNAVALTTTLTPLPNVGVHPRLCNVMKAAGRRPALLRHFVNGTAIGIWQKGSTHGDRLRMGWSNLRGHLVGDYSSSRAALVVNICEIDAALEASANAYEGDLRTMLDTLDADFGNMPTIVIGLHASFSACPFRAIVRAGQAVVVAEKAHRRLVNPDAITDITTIHYTTPGFAQLADLIWAAYLDLVG